MKIRVEFDLDQSQVENLIKLAELGGYRRTPKNDKELREKVRDGIRILIAANS